MPKIDDKAFLRFLFILILPAILLYTALDRGGTFATTKELSSILLWGIAAMLLVGIKKVPIPPVGLTVLWILFWLWGAVTIIWSFSPDLTLIWIIQFGSLLMLLWFAYSLAEKPLTSFFRICAVAIAIIIAIGYFFLIGARTGIFVGRHDMMLHFISTFFWKNPAAGYLCLVSPVLFALSLTDEKKGWRIFYGIISSLSLSALILTRSRGAWLAFAFASFVTILLMLPYVKKFWKVSSVVAVSAIVISSIIMPPEIIIKRFRQISEVAKEEPEEPVQERRMMLDMGRRMMADHPITGVGMGAVKVAYPSYLESSHYLSTHLHNQYLQYGAEGGVISGLLFAAAIFVSIFIVLRHVYKTKDLLLCGIATGTLAYALHIGVDFDWEFWGTSLPFLVFLAVGLRLSTEGKGHFIDGKRKILPAIIVFLGFLLSVIASTAGTLFEKYQAELDFFKRERLLMTCVKLNPLSGRYYYELAQLYNSHNDIQKTLHFLDKAYELEPKYPILDYAYASLLWNINRDLSVEHFLKAVSAAPYILPEQQLNFAQEVRDAGMIDIAEKAFSNIISNFSADTTIKYSENSAGYRYIIARALAGLAAIRFQAGDYLASDSLFRISYILGCPRYKDRLAKQWALDIISPEQTVYELLDAVNVGDTIRAMEYIADSAIVRLSPGYNLFLLQILDVRQDMIEEKASVDALLMRVHDGKVSNELAFFNLILKDGRWRVVFGY